MRLNKNLERFRDSVNFGNALEEYATMQNDILQQALTWKESGLHVALATVISTWGSAPRPVGSQLAVNDRGDMVGSVSGGCIEGSVVEEALDIMGSGDPKLMEFGISNSRAWQVGLACGGKIKVFIEPLA